ncbi:MAG: YfhO family protein [Thermoanaerobaculia bacterium]
MPTSSGPFRSALAGGLAGLFLSILLLGPDFLAGLVPARGDLADFFWPMKAYTAARWRAGGIPLWNPLSGCGEPWLAQLQSGVFYPGDLPFFLSFPIGPFAGIALHLIVAAAGMAFWLDDLGASRRAAVASAFVYAGGGAFLSLFPVYNNACTAALLPWVFVTARRVMRGRNVAGFALASALALLAGEPALATAGILSASVLAWATRSEGEPVPRESARRAALRLLSGAALAVGLGAVTLLPFAELVVGSGRVSGVTREEALAGAIGSGELGDLVLPPRVEATRQPQPGRGGYLASLAGSPLTIVLAAGCVAGFPGRRRFLALLAALAGCGLLLSLGSRGLLMPALHDSGLIRGLRFPARWFVFTHLALAVAVGAGLDGWIHGTFRLRDPEEEPTSSGRTARIAALALLLLLPLLFLAAVAHVETRDLRRAVAVLGATAIGILLLAYLRRSSARKPEWAGGLLLLALVAPLPLVARDPLEAVPVRELAGEPRITRRSSSGGRTFTVAGDAVLLAAFTRPRGEGWTPEVPRLAHEVLAGYTNLPFGIPLAGSASPIPNRQRTAMLGAALQGGDAARLLGLADVHHVVTPFPTAMPGARLVSRVDGVYRYELATAVGRLFFVREAHVATDQETSEMLRKPSFRAEASAALAEDLGAPAARKASQGYAVAKLVTDEPESTEIATSCSAPSVAIVTRSFDPGWRVTVDGNAVKSVRADLAFLAFAVPAGEHRVVLTYRPLSFRIGSILSIVSLVMAGALVAAGGPVD